MTEWDESKGYMPGTNQRNDAELANEGMTQLSLPTCSWRPGDGEALRIALSIHVTSAALAALNREMAQLQTHYPTGVCTAQHHLEAIAVLNQQLAALTPVDVNSPVRTRRKGVAGGVVPNPLPLSNPAGEHQQHL
jgi:hypothetical protein